MPARALRFVVLGCALLVGLLSLAVVSPDIHSALHGQHQGSAEQAGQKEPSGTEGEAAHHCVVTLFSQGIESGFTPMLVLGAPEPVITEAIALADQVARAARTAAQPPGRGPPLC